MIRNNGNAWFVIPGCDRQLVALQIWGYRALGAPVKRVQDLGFVDHNQIEGP